MPVVAPSRQPPLNMSTTNIIENSTKTDGNRLFTAPRASISGNGDLTTVQLDLPGVSRDGLEITVEDQSLTIVGRRMGNPVNGTRVHSEIRQLDYRRVFELAPSIDTTRIGADLRDGVLTLTLPTAEKVKPRRITVS